MKKTLLSAMLLIVAIFTSGCTSRNAEGINIVEPSIKESNSKIKVYYEDRTEGIIRDNLSAMSDYINKNTLKPLAVHEKPTTDASDFGEYDRSIKRRSNTENYTFNIKCHTDFSDTGNYISVDKIYTSRNEAYFDITNIIQSIRAAYESDESLKEKFALGYVIVDDKMLDNKILRFTIYKEKAYRFISSAAKKQFLESGFQIVNSPKDADKIYYFELTRDYFQSELARLKKEGKSINLGVATAGNDNTGVMNSTMNFASHSNGVGTSLGAAAGAGLAMSLLDGFFAPEVSPVIPTMKVINNITKEEYIQTFYIGFNKYDFQEKDFFLGSMKYRVAHDKPYERIKLK